MTTPTQNVAALCRELDVVVVEYRDALAAKAEAEATYKTERAKRILRARIEDEASSMVLAETFADADDVVAGLRRDYLIKDGIASAYKERLASLRERIGFGRSVMTNEREQDRLAAAQAGGTP